MLPGQEGSGVRLYKVSDNQHVVGVGVWQGAGVEGAQRPPRPPSEATSLALAESLRRRSSQGWAFGRAAPRTRLRQRAATMAGGGDDVALAATRAGVGRIDESGRGVEDDTEGEG